MAPSHLTPSGQFQPRIIKCNCKNSKCLKLYCECFRNGRYCKGCNCKNCQNTEEFEDLRQKAIKSIKHRNPNAFKPRIAVANQDKKLIHTKGCSCKKSGCNKKYCECFLNGVYCTEMCKCSGCKNCDPKFNGKKHQHQPTEIPQPKKHTKKVITRGKKIQPEPSKPKTYNQNIPISTAELKKFEQTSEYGGVVIPNVSHQGSHYEPDQHSAKKYDLYSPIKGYFNSKFQEDEILGKRQPFEQLQMDDLVNKRLKSIQNSTSKRGKENIEDEFQVDLKHSSTGQGSHSKRFSSRIRTMKLQF